MCQTHSRLLPRMGKMVNYQLINLNKLNKTKKRF
jgi:hypothetical protein